MTARVPGDRRRDHTDACNTRDDAGGDIHPVGEPP